MIQDITDLYIQGMKCGIINLRYFPQDLRARNLAALKRTLKSLLCPIDLWRYVEFPYVLSHIKNNGEFLNILDIGSPKFLSVLIAQKYNHEVIATDILPIIIEEVNWYKRANSKGNLKGQIEDGTSLSFEDEKFSIVFSVSCLEHIGNDGDIRAIKEMARVLLPGGKLLITVPFVTTFRELWTEEDPMGCQVRSSEGKVFFSRYYDLSSLQSRLIEPSGLKLLEIKAWQETIPTWYGNKYLPRVVKSYTGIFAKFLDYYYSKSRIQAIYPGDLTNHGVAGVALEKH
jgi:SAM-dependent methyltransferase